MPQAATTVFDEGGVHVVRLGELTHHDGDDVLTFTDRATRNTRTLSFPKDSFDFLQSLDPTDTDRDFTAGEKALLLQLADNNAVKFARESAGLDDLDFVPVQRTRLVPVERTEDGYVIRPQSGENEFSLSTIGAQLLALTDGHRSLRAILEEFRRLVFSDPEVRAIAEEDARAAGRTIDQILLDEGLRFVAAAGAVSAITVEPETATNS